jgi:hypothetical protein
MDIGMLYMEKFGTKRLEDAGDCFAITECWSLAAEVYFKARCYAKCFSCCSKGKVLNLGLQFLRQLEKEQCEKFNSDFAAVRKTYLENCALHYFERGDIKHMMPYVKDFDSMDHIRAFLNSRNLLDELLSIEMEMGNFLEAAGIAERKGDILLEVNILEKAESFVNATQLLLLYVTANSLWSPYSRGWPPKSFAEKEQLLIKVKEMAKKVSEDFFCFACFEADFLSDSHKSLTSLTYSLLEGRKCGNLLIELISARYIIDVHLQSQISAYNLELEPGSEDELCYKMLACNQMSLETLACIWNQWRLILAKVLAQLYPSEVLKSNDSAAMCEDLCAKFFGLRKDSDNRYVVLNVDSGWLANTGRSYLEQDGNRCWLDTVHCQSCARNFLVNELSSVGLSVLHKLESIFEASREKTSSPYAQWRNTVILYEIAMFLKDSEFCMAKSSKKLRNSFILCEQSFFRLLFLTWGDETAESFFYILDSPPAYGLIVDSLGSYTRVGNQNLTHGHLGRVTMYLLYTAKSDDMLNLRLEQYLNPDSEWAHFFQSLKKFLDSGVGRCPLVENFKQALKFTFDANWRERDYMSPICYMNLMECLGFFALSRFMLNSCVLCTKSMLVKMLKCRTSKAFLDSCLVSGLGDQDMDLDCMAYAPGVFICRSIRFILENKHDIQEWVRKTKPAITYVPVLLRLVIMLYLLTLTLQLGDCYEVTAFLHNRRIFEDLPPDFSKKIVPLKSRFGTVAHFTRVFGDALAAIGNPMVVLGLPEGPLISRGLNAYRISIMDLSDVNKVMAYLRSEEQKSAMQEETKTCNVTSGNFPITRMRDNEMDNRIEMHLSDESISFWEKFESFQVFIMHGQVS